MVRHPASHAQLNILTLVDKHSGVCALLLCCASSELVIFTLCECVCMCYDVFIVLFQLISFIDFNDLEIYLTNNTLVALLHSQPKTANALLSLTASFAERWMIGHLAHRC